MVQIKTFQECLLFFFVVPWEAFHENSDKAQIVLFPISKYVIILVRIIVTGKRRQSEV